MSAAKHHHPRARAASAALALVLLGCSSSPPATSLGPDSAGASSVASAGASGVFDGAGGESGLIATMDPGVSTSSCFDKEITVLFLIDRSGSMNCNLPPLTASTDCEKMAPPAKVDSTQPSKWEVIGQTLSGALDSLMPTDSLIQVRAGVTYFSVDGVCGATSAPAVPIQTVTAAQLDAIRQSVAKQTPNGGTPIVGATVLAYKELYQTLGVTGSAHVILITDGADSCSDYYAANPAIGPGDHVEDLIQAQAPKAREAGIETWVVGAPGSEPARHILSSLAVAGGTRRSTDCNPGTAADPSSGDCHYDMTLGDFQSGLKTALEHIMAVVTCRPIR